MASFVPIGVVATVKGLNVFNTKMGKMKLSIGGVAKSITSFAAVSALAMTAALAAIGKASLDAAIEFEDSFAGVRKTVETTEEEFDRLAMSMRDLATIVPIDVNDLNAIAELGGQLGVVEADTEDVTGTLTEFTRVIAALGVSTNLTTEAAATQLARFANIMGTTAEFGTETYSRLGASIVQLGNNMATTESDILNFALRIAGAGEIAGLTEAQVFAIGAAMSSVGVQANAGGTAVQKTLLAMNEAVTLGNDDLEIFAATAGMTAEQFAAAFEEDAGKAFQAFVNGLGDAGDDAILVLDALELKDQRLVRAFLSLANAEGVLDKAFDESNKGFEENIALNDEAAKKYATTKSQIQIMKNIFNDLAIELGNVLLPTFNVVIGGISNFVKYITFAINEGDTMNDFLATFPAFMQPFIQGIGDAIAGMQNFVSFLIFTVQSGDPLNDFLARFPESIQPFIQGLGEAVLWLQQMIPVAIGTTKAFFETVLLPAMQKVGTWIKESLFPVLLTIASWFQQLLPIAIDELKTWWEAVLLPALMALEEQWKQNIEPALAELWAWLQERVPQAIATLALFWENVLKPALQAIGTFIADTLIPIFGMIVTWLLKNIPVAIDEAVKFWEEVLFPALETVWKFIQENVIPIFEDVVVWLQENIPPALEELAKYWEETLLPAIEAVWKFIQDYLFPLFAALGELIGAAVTLAVQTLALIWEETLLPALKSVWKFIKEEFFPLFEKLGNWLQDNFLAGLDEIWAIIVRLTTKFKEWAQVIRDIDVSKLNPFTKQSPVPLAEGLKEVGKQMRHLSRFDIPMFNSQLAVSGALANAPVSALPVVPSNNVTINMGQNNISSNVDAAVFEANVLRVVTENIG